MQSRPRPAENAGGAFCVRPWAPRFSIVATGNPIVAIGFSIVVLVFSVAALVSAASAPEVAVTVVSAAATLRGAAVCACGLPQASRATARQARRMFIVCFMMCWVCLRNKGKPFRRVGTPPDGVFSLFNAVETPTPLPAAPGWHFAVACGGFLPVGSGVGAAVW